MRLIAFPGRGEEGSSHEELDAALRGEGERATAAAWCELREDVRALTPPMSADFERVLGKRVDAWAESSTQRASPAPRSPGSERARNRWKTAGRLRAASGLGALATLIAALAIVASSLSGGRVGAAHTAGPQLAPLRPAGRKDAARSATSASASPAKAVNAPQAPRTEQSNVETGRGEGSTPARVQQLAASITLSSSPDGVQSVADRVARLAVSDGGYVQSSQVQQRREGASEANLDLRVPSGRLSAALASIGQLAPTRAESRSLQDITSTYDAARRGLTDAVTERQALLRALSRASTQGQIDSLREQLALAGGAITRARSALAAISARGGISVVEVTVLGDARAASGGGTLDRGLHDAGGVLAVGLVVLLIGVAALLPLTSLVAALAIGRRAWRRYSRERALEQP